MLARPRPILALANAQRQNLLSPKNLRSAEIAFRYTNTTGRWRQSTMTKGIAGRIAAGAERPKAGFSQTLRGFDVGTALPWSNSSAVALSPAGAVSGRRRKAVAAYYFGSFRTQLRDDRTRSVLEMESSPDSGSRDRRRRFAKIPGEVNLPPIRFRRTWYTGLCIKLRPPGAVRGAMANQRTDGSVIIITMPAVRSDFNFSIAMRLPMIFSIGAAAGFATAIIARPICSLPEDYVNMDRP